MFGMAPWALSRLEPIFGEDVNVFRPERWLESEETNKSFEKVDVTYGSGYCVCLGKEIALMETYKSVVEVSGARLRLGMRNLLNGKYFDSFLEL